MLFYLFEYLQFLTTPQSDQRVQLLPVLVKLLSLSDTEMQRVKHAAIDELQHQNLTSSSDNQTAWSSYLPRWSGV
jgi:hypothetical protein